MLETSKDLLYIVLAFCVIWATVFLCWVFYYVARLLRNANQIVEEFRVRLQILLDAVNYIRNKVENISTLMTLATEGAAGLVKKVINRKTREWTERGSAAVNQAAKAAVDRAVEATAKKMRKTAKAVKK